jgi:hypothetical protein
MWFSHNDRKESQFGDLVLNCGYMKGLIIAIFIMLLFGCYCPRAIYNNIILCNTISNIYFILRRLLTNSLTNT